MRKKIESRVDNETDSASVKSEESLGFVSDLQRKNSATSSSTTNEKENFNELPVLSARHILGLKQDLIDRRVDEDEGEGCVMCSS
jgi:hypothetical protein